MLAQKVVHSHDAAAAPAPAAGPGKGADWSNLVGMIPHFTSGGSAPGGCGRLELCACKQWSDFRNS